MRSESRVKLAWTLPSREEEMESQSDSIVLLRLRKKG